MVIILIVAVYSANEQFKMAGFPSDIRENTKCGLWYYVCTLKIKTSLYVNALDSYYK